DLVTGNDVRDVAGVEAATRETDAVVHLAALPAHRRRPSLLRDLSVRDLEALGEEVCALTTRTTGMSTICLRIPVVIEPDRYSRMWAESIETTRRAARRPLRVRVVRKLRAIGRRRTWRRGSGAEPSGLAGQLDELEALARRSGPEQ